MTSSAETEGLDPGVEIPLHDFLGVPRVLTEDENVRLEIPLGEQLRGIALPVHGGVVSALIDVACGVAAGTTELWLEGQVPATTEMHVRYFGQPRQGPLIVEAGPVHRGRRLISIECQVTDGTGKVVARATASYLIIDAGAVMERLANDARR